MSYPYTGAPAVQRHAVVFRFVVQGLCGTSNHHHVRKAASSARPKWESIVAKNRSQASTSAQSFDSKWQVFDCLEEENNSTIEAASVKSFPLVYYASMLKRYWFVQGVGPGRIQRTLLNAAQCCYYGLTKADRYLYYGQKRLTCRMVVKDGEMRIYSFYCAPEEHFPLIPLMCRFAQSLNHQT